MITSDQNELDKRLNKLRNRFNILTFLQTEGMYWIDVVMSGNDNPFFPRDNFISLYNGEGN